MISAKSVSEIFKAQSIAAVAIIDDAFNSVENPSATEAAALYEQFAADPEIQQAFAELELPLEGEEHVTADSIRQLKGAAAASAGAKTAMTLVQASGKARRARLDELSRKLRKLGVKVKPIPATRARSAKKPIIDQDVNLVLLDYDLGDEGEVGALSRQIVAGIYNQFKDSERAPLVILMSSRDLQESDVSAFQKGTKVLSGMFYFVRKDDLFDEERRNYRLAAFARSLQTGQTLQNFVSKVEGALAEARDKVFADVRVLSISDFTYLKMLRLHEDGEPLGEYLMWLMSAHLLNYLAAENDLKGALSKVNGLKFDHLPPTQAQPSAGLAMLYSSAVMRAMPAFAPEGQEPGESLQFGDLFRAKKGNKVWLCITAPCDLASSPTRPIPSDRSVFFIPGKLRPIEKELTAFERRMPRTELLWLDGKVHRILWLTKEVDKAAWGKLGEWQNGKNVARIARLHTPFALEIQRAFAADLTRIGMPVPPPLYSPQSIRLSCLDEHGKELELTTEGARQALSVGGERGVRLIMGEGFMNSLPQMLASAKETLERRKAALQKAVDKNEVGPGAITDANAAIDKIEALRSDASLLSGIRGPFDVPEPGQPRKVVQDSILLCHEEDAKKGNTWTPLRLVLVPPPEGGEENEAAAA